MKKIAGSILLVSLIMACPAKSSGEMYNGQMLLDDCRQFLKFMEDKEDPSVVISSTGYCLGCLQGHIDFERYFGGKVPVKINHCFPVYTTLTQLEGITVSYLQDNPDKLNEPAMEIVEAFEESFPCEHSAVTNSK